MISGHISRASAVFLLLGGVALLFASDAILPRVISNFPATAAWLGQLLGSAWLAVAALNWLSRSALLGGIYGRPVVAANAALYFITSMVLLRFVSRGDAPVALWIGVVPFVVFAGTYAWLMYRGPIASDFEKQRRASLG